MYDFMTSDTIVDAIATLRYLQSAWDATGTVDEINMVHVKSILAKIEVDRADYWRERTGFDALIMASE